MRTAQLYTFTLVFLITGAIDSIRNLPSMALFGDSLIFFFLLSAILFLIPVALVSATLSACWPEQGGIYHWTRRAFGEKAALLSIWLQWINTIVWLPTILSFIATTSAYLIDPSLAANKYYLFSIILLLNVLLTWSSLKGIQVSATISTFCAIVGTIVPIIFILILGIIWIWHGQPMQLTLSAQSLTPHLSNVSSWVSLTAIITSFLGVELASVHIKDVYNPKRTFPKALAISVFLIISTIFFGAMIIALVLPKAKIGLVNGIPEVFSYFLHAFHLQYFLPYIIALMIIGSFGGVISWFISPARGLLQAVDYGYLPPFFAKLNRKGVPANLLLVQSFLTFILSISFLIIPKINSIYWFLTDLSTQLYVLMYVMMFLAALALLPHVKQKTGAFKIPGGTFGYILVCVFGLIGSLSALVVGFITPGDFNLSETFSYQLIFAGAMLVMISPVLLLYFYASFKNNKLAQTKTVLT